MKWEAFKDKFHESWHDKIRPFIESEACNDIYAFLKSESGRGVKIAPLSIHTFRAFKETPLDELKCVLMFQDPYFKFINNAPVADGLAIGCSVTNKLQPTLSQFYSGLEQELYNGLNLDWDGDVADVEYLAHQGVLMLNASLSVEKDKPGSHKHIWKPFTEYLIKNVFNEYNVPVVLLGKEAQEYEESFTIHHLFKCPHPASASYNGGKWNTNGIFTKLNKILWEEQHETVAWLPQLPF